MSKKINILDYVKWIWRFSPILWSFILLIGIPVVAEVFVTQLGILIIVMEVVLCAVVLIVWFTWFLFGNYIKCHSKEWWESRPK